VLSAVVAMRATLNGPTVRDPAVPIYVNEIGWVTAGTTPSWLPVYTESQRASAIQLITDQLATSDCGVRQIVPHTMVSPENAPWPGLASGDKERWYGIFNADGTPKPSGQAYSDVVHQLEASPRQPVVHLCGS